MDQEKSNLVAVKTILKQPSVNRPNHSQYQFNQHLFSFSSFGSLFSKNDKVFEHNISLRAKCSSSWKFWICQHSKIKIHTSRLPYHIINMGYWPRLVGYWPSSLLFFLTWLVQESRQSPKCGPNLDTKFCREVFVEFYIYTPTVTPHHVQFF